MDWNSNFDAVTSKDFAPSDFADLFTCKGKF